MSKNLVFFLISLVFLLAIFLRFYKLGEIPPSLDWDEASLGYNAYTILKTGRDEYGNSLPLSIRSFNDYKASLYVYLSVLPIALFGLSEFSIRFISAFFGSLTVLLSFFLIKETCKLDEKIDKKGDFLALLTSFFLAISPWHLQFSRVAFEANLALFFFVLGTFLLILSLENNLFLPVGAFVYGISLFTYHSCRLVVPVFVVVFVLISRKKLLRKKFYSLLSAIIAIGFITLLLYSFRLGGYSRFKSTSVFADGGNVGEGIKKVVSGYFAHFDFNFLFVRGDPQTRHHATGIAQLYLWELPFVIAGIFFLIKDKFKGNFLIFWWFLTASLASALTVDIPNAVRSLLFLPTFQFFTAYGIFSFYQSIKKNVFKFPFLVLSFALCALSLVYYLHMYFIHGPLETSQDWLYGYKELVEFVGREGNNYQKVIITTNYDQPYIYFLFYQKPLKVLFNDGEFYKGFGNLEFRPINWKEDEKLRNVLLAGTQEEIPENKRVLKEIKFLDGDIAFRIVGL